MRLLVRWEEPARAREALLNTPPLLRELGGRVMWASEYVPGIAIREVPEGLEETSRLLLTETREFRIVGRDCWASGLTTPNDPRWTNNSQPPSLDPICIQSLWSHRTVATEPIAVVDSGVAFFSQGSTLFPHLDLANNIMKNPADPIDGIDNDNNGYVDDYWGTEFFPPNPNGSTFPLPQDQSGHGTAMASIMGAVGNNELEIAGIAWTAQLLIIKYSDNEGVATASSILQSLEYAHKRGARLINCSWQIFANDPTGVVAVYDFINETPDSLYVQAAGNAGINLDANCYDYFPAEWSLPNMLLVGGTDIDDSPWSLNAQGAPCDVRADDNTNYGATLVDVMAPAEPIWGLSIHTPSGAAVAGAGTSDAAAIVSGIAALVWTEFPAFTNLQVKDRIMAKADVISGLSGWCVTGARVDAARAVSPNGCE